MLVNQDILSNKIEKYNSETLYGAIDLGTNNCQMIIGRWKTGRFEKIDWFSKIVRLGEGLDSSGYLSEHAMQRTIAALGVCVKLFQKYNVQNIRAVATAACRRANNVSIFIRRVKVSTGLNIEVISPEEEAGLAFLGCRPLIKRKIGNALIIDIGGGSTELLWVNSELLELKSWTSLNLGVVTLFEKYGGETISSDIFDAMLEDTSTAVESFFETVAFKSQVKNSDIQIIGTSGTVTTIASIYLELKKYDHKKVDGLCIPLINIKKIVSKLLKINYRERNAIPCVGEGRGDILLAGCAILMGILSGFKCDQIVAADRGLREGILQEYMHSEEGDS